MFDAILSPVVLTHICLFPERELADDTNSFAEQIQSLLLGKHDLAIYTTLTLCPENWKCSDKVIGSPSPNVRMSYPIIPKNIPDLTRHSPKVRFPATKYNSSVEESV
jgi:hypothetical protein